MDRTRYLATLYVNDVNVFDGYGNDLQVLIVNLMTQLDSENNHAKGTIVDKRTGRVVYRCRKAMCE